MSMRRMKAVGPWPPGRHNPLVQEETFEGQARQLTEDTIRAGEADVIYQACFNDGRWRGFADFLERQPGGGYEPVDTKLARAARPVHVLQLCFYADQVGRIQGRLPERMHAQLGSGERETFRTSEYIAYYRRVRARFLTAIDESPETYPWPCEHCPVCVWRRECHKRIVAMNNWSCRGLGRSHADSLTEAGSQARGSRRRRLRASHRGSAAETFEALRHQAELQLHHRRTGEHRVDLLPAEAGTGVPASRSRRRATSGGLEGHPS